MLMLGFAGTVHDMHIALVTPAPPGSRAGNRATASRWAGMLREQGHRVDIMVEYNGEKADLMIALHAWRSAASIQHYKKRYPRHPLVVVLTGTDAYRFIHSHAETTLRSIRLADKLVGLHALIAEVLPPELRGGVEVIYQSAQAVGARDPYRRYFHVSVMGHLREEKDPLRPAFAVRSLPQQSRIQVHQFGKPHTPEWADLAIEEMRTNHRYTWHGEVPHYRVRQIYRRTHLLVLPSRMEGGANVISEAVVAGVPVLASRIDGSVGLLGEDYPGYYPVENAAALRELLLRAEQDSNFYDRLAKRCDERRSLFTPEAEAANLNRLISGLK